MGRTVLRVPFLNQRRYGMDFRFAVFILASLLAHLALLGISHDQQLPEIGGKAEALQVTLTRGTTRSAAAARPAQENAGIPLQETSPARPSPVQATPKIRRQHQANLAPSQKVIPARNIVPPTPQRSTAIATARASAPSRHASEQISAALQNQLAQNFSYPWLARKRGWQGRVTLSLHVGENGKLTRWKVAKTSGYRLLDRTALDNAKRIQALPEAAGLLNGNALDLLVPIHYRLLDS